ncbi:hypothetical protein ACODT5_38520 [Streptomyces sp. 5.8]|uniref:hypothetical protein n=1 Tax=Streptomyces sp. 5.8 TaxID=3406571 RepID=UPI003BB7F956
MSVEIKPRLRRLATTAAGLAALAVPLAAATPAQASTQNVYATYREHDPFGNVIFSVTFNGTVTDSGPTGYVLDGDFFADCNPGLIFNEKAAVGHGPASGGYTWITVDCNKPVDQHIHATGTRGAGDDVDVKVGGTGGLVNVWQYGDRERIDIG